MPQPSGVLAERNANDTDLSSVQAKSIVDGALDSVTPMNHKHQGALSQNPCFSIVGSPKLCGKEQSNRSVTSTKPISSVTPLKIVVDNLGKDAGVEGLSM